MKNILIVEDESLVALEISTFIQKLHHNPCGIASNAHQAWEIVASLKVDLILMDIFIKGDIDGIDCAKKIKEEHDIPIIYISAFSDDETLARAIQTDPSSYLIKPFNSKELQIAIKIAFAHLKHSPQIMKKGDCQLDKQFSYDTQTQELIQSGEVIHLTKQERKLLELFLDSKQRVISIYELENELWPHKPSNENTRRALVARLRAKLNYQFIQTVHSIGYRFLV